MTKTIGKVIENYIQYVSNRLSMTWEDYYELAKAYYEHHDNLLIPAKFKQQMVMNMILMVKLILDVGYQLKELPLEKIS